MQHFEKIAEGIPVQALLGQLEAHPELWDAYTARKVAPGTPHTRMSDIWVRYNDVTPFVQTGDYRTFNDAHVPVWYPAWAALPALRPIVMGVMAQVQGEMLGGVLITRIPPGEGIGRHSDDGWHVQYYDKFYLSLKNAPGAVFWCDADGVTEGLTPKPGELWLFDNRKPHWVVNESQEDRITLIICIRTALFGRQEAHVSPA